MYYTVYKITNQVDGKIYIGSHKTKDLNDSYMGSGKYLKYAQEKYGIDKFTKEILFVFECAEEMYAKEAELVTEEFLATENTYNLKIGGFGGFDHINSDDSKRIQKNKKAAKVTQTKHGDKLSTWGKKGGASRIKKHGLCEKFHEAGKTSMKGKHHTEDAKQKISEKNSLNQRGHKNSQFGSMWITDGISNKKVPKDSIVPEGWYKGRRVK